MNLRLEDKRIKRAKTNQLTRIINFLRIHGASNYTRICKECFESGGRSDIRNGINWLLSNNIILKENTLQGIGVYHLNPNFEKIQIKKEKNYKPNYYK